jgi:hypothetical protein
MEEPSNLTAYQTYPVCFGPECRKEKETLPKGWPCTRCYLIVPNRPSYYGDLGGSGRRKDEESVVKYEGKKEAMFISHGE